MVGTGEGAGVAGVRPAQFHAAMTALVQEYADGHVLLAHHQHRVFSDIGGEEISGFLNLRLMRNKDPGAAENPLQFKLVQAFIGVDTRIERAAVFIHQIQDFPARPAHGAGQTGNQFIIVHGASP